MRVGGAKDPTDVEQNLEMSRNTRQSPTAPPSSKVHPIRHKDGTPY